MHCLNLNYCISVTRNTPSEDVQYHISSEESSAGDMPLCDEVRIKKKTLRKRREVQTPVRRQTKLPMSRNHLYVMTREERKKVRARRKILLTMKRIKMRAIAHANNEDDVIAASESDDMSDDTTRSEDAESDKSESTTESIAEIECEDATAEKTDVSEPESTDKDGLVENGDTGSGHGMFVISKNNHCVIYSLLQWKVVTLGVAMVCL